MTLSGYSQDGRQPLIVYDSTLHRVSKVIVEGKEYGVFSKDEINALNELGDIFDECSESTDSLLSQINNCSEALFQSRKVNADLRILKHNCDSISDLKDSQIRFKSNQYNSEKDISAFYKNKSSSWITVAGISIAVNVGLIYYIFRHPSQ
jgi:hypothetical protein